MEDTLFERIMLVTLSAIGGIFIGLGIRLALLSDLMRKFMNPVPGYMPVSNPPPVGTMVLGYNAAWLFQWDDRDNTSRECYIDREGVWVMSVWNNSSMTWDTINHIDSIGCNIDAKYLLPPTHWCHIPKFKL